MIAAAHRGEEHRVAVFLGGNARFRFYRFYRDPRVISRQRRGYRRGSAWIRLHDAARRGLARGFPNTYSVLAHDHTAFVG